MRIIAGIRRGHKIDGPGHPATRPTSDPVREAIFNILGAAPEDADVYDLFAGSGALGLEALSRGANHATLVERDRQNLAAIRRNLVTLRFEDRAAVVAGDVHRWAKRFDPDPARPALLFVDPPYPEYEGHPERIRSTLASLWERMPPGSWLVVESGRAEIDHLLPPGAAADRRTYGHTRVTILIKPVPEGPPDAADVPATA